jgi:hypothetical protein
VLLVAIDPSGERHEQHLRGVDIGYHGPIVPRPTPACVPEVSVEYSDPTGSTDFQGSSLEG